ncbi:RNA polymerase subunit sigma-70 [Actinopolymorpha singaporensis]
MSSAEPLDLHDESAFAALFERHRGELQVHCYRMLGSLEDAEDLVQETFLRAWRSRETFGADGRFSFRAWVYRIATNACLDELRSRSRRVLPPDVAPAADPTVPLSPPADLPWIQPYPDRLLDQVTAPEEEPGAVVVARETIELAFITAIQHLPPRQRAALILRDVLGWSAKETASLLETTVASANSAVQRARGTVRQHLGERTAWRTRSEPTPEERELLRRYVEAHESADADALAALLREDARLTMPPHPTWYEGRAAIMVAAAPAFDPAFGTLRSVPVRANRQPGAAHYLRASGETEFRPLAIDVLRVEDGRVAEITSFDGSAYFVMFGLPLTLDR